MMKAALRFLGLMAMSFLAAAMLTVYACSDAFAQTLTPATPDANPVPIILLLGAAGVCGGMIYLRRKNRQKFDEIVGAAKDVQHTVGNVVDDAQHAIAERLHRAQTAANSAPTTKAVVTARNTLAELRARLEAEARNVFPQGHEVVPGTHTNEQEDALPLAQPAVRVVNGVVIRG